MSAPEEIEAALRQATEALPAGGEDRAGQAEMARAVGRAIDRGRHLIVQAGTGTGKSLAYLVPVLLSGAPAVVATATKALQDQLARRDLPLLAEQLDVDVTFAVLKGRSNYFCRQRAAELDSAPAQLGLEASSPSPADAGVGELGREIRRLVEWGRTTPTGDRAELAFEPRPYAWQSVSVTSTECPGATRCPMGAECFAEQARQRAAAADVVVVNTHLYGAHLASQGAVLPEHAVVVFDEAHELEDVVSDSLSVEMGPGRLRAVSRQARGVIPPRAALSADRLSDAADRLESALGPLAGRRLVPPYPEDLQTALALVTAALANLMPAVREVDEGEPARARLVQAMAHLTEDLQKVMSVGSDQVAWVEKADRLAVLRVAPIEVGPSLAERLWGSVTAILTSATIPPRLAERVGLAPGKFDQIDVGSPFPYDQNGLLYCATHLPDPRTSAYPDALVEELEALITAAGGRTLALFTSWRAMESAASALHGRLPGPLLTQSDLPKPALVEAFAVQESASLFATQGFFQGVDIPGRTLSLVCIDRIPFPRPDDPLNQARRDRAGPAAFSLVDLPRAATLLAQAAGRLIRRAEDRGVVAVLDPRLGRANYRWELVNALPPMRRTRHRGDVEEFLRTITTDAPSPTP